MVVKYEDLRKELYDTPLNEEEMKALRSAEEYVDQQLVSKFHSSSSPVYVSITEIDQRIIGKHRSARRDKIHETLMQMYRSSGGWKVTINRTYNDSHDYWEFNHPKSH